jgi:hypothetical protein
VDPFSAAGMAAVGAASSAGGGLLSAFGQLGKGESDAKMYAYRAGVAKMNATINRQNSDYALEAGELSARRSGLTTGFTIGKQKVAQAANGFDVNSGTNEAVRDTTRDIGIGDQTTIRTEGGRKALGFRNQAASEDAEAGAMLIAGDNAKRAGKIAALGTLIGTAGSVASKWVQASQVFGGGSGAGVTLYGQDQNVTGWIK